MPDLESATHYPGTVLFEGTNVSVGRGTPIAFQVLGAPWFDPSSLLPLLQGEPGVLVSDTVITPHEPADGKYADVTLPALRFRVADREVYDPTRLALRLFAAIRDVHRDSLRLTAGLERLAGSSALRDWIESGEGYEQLYSSWQEELLQFEAVRQAFLIYEPSSAIR